MGGAASCSTRGSAGPLLEVAKVGDFGDAPSMKEIELPDQLGSILVVKTNKGFRAIGSKCTHYGAPLVKGSVTDTKVRCPWHGACFSLDTGDIEESPGLDSLPCFRTRVKDGAVYINKPESVPARITRPLGKMCKQAPTIVVVGAGTSALACVQTLRQEKFPGRIVLIGKDANLPYDRTKLSKAPGSSWEDIKLRDAAFYKDNDIELMLEKEVTKVDFENRQVQIAGESSPVQYDKLVIATGVRSRTLSTNTPGANLKNIVALYNINDSAFIASKAENKNVVIIGSSFIAMELATSLKAKAKSITILGRSKVPYGHLLGPAVGKTILNHLLKSPDGGKVKYLGNEEAKAFEGDSEGNVKQVITATKRTLEADLVVLAIGALPNTEFLTNTSLALNKGDGAIVVNKFLETNVKGVFAMGDAVMFPTNYATKGKASICHWGMAQNHGRVVAQNLMGKSIAVNKMVPFFWTFVAGLSVRYAGYGEGYTDTLVFGSLESLEFCTLYMRSNKVLAAATVGCDPLAVQIANEMETGIRYTKDLPTVVVERFPKPPTIGQ